MVVYSNNSLPTVEMAKAVLIENDINAVILNQQDSVYMTFGDINLLVSKEYFLKASALIKDFQGE